ncbi:MAG: phage virion morphogenesis protein [bacterium]|nr:phage virion morphogenesis protein [bacterium]
MPEAFHMKIEGFDELVEKLTALKEAVENKEAIHQVIATELFHATERAFEEKHDPNTGKSWKDWSPGYVRHLKKIGQYGKGSLLYQKGDNGGLFNSIHYWANSEGAHIGANIKYARLHQLGGEINIGPHRVGPAHVKEHKRKYKGKTVTVRAHERSGYLNLMGGGKRTIPARPYLGLDAQAREDIQQTIRNLLEEALDG